MGRCRPQVKTCWEILSIIARLSTLAPASSAAYENASVTAYNITMSNAPASVPASAPAVPLGAAPNCEISILARLGQNQAYNASGYTINTELPTNFTTDAWQSLGCLSSLTSITLNGSLPDLPNSWADNGNFKMLQVMNFSNSGLAGTLPASWASPTAFPQLRLMNFSVTSLSGTLPTAWGQAGSWFNLTELHLAETNISGMPIHPQQSSESDNHTSASKAAARPQKSSGIHTSFNIQTNCLQICCQSVWRLTWVLSELLDSSELQQSPSHHYTCHPLLACLRIVYAVSPHIIRPMTSQLIDLQVHRLKS